MSSTITSPALYLLQQLNTSTASSLDAIINGQSGTTSSTDPISALLNAEKNETADVKAQASQPQTKAEISHFLSVVSSAKDLKTILADPIAQKVLLTANGLGDQVGYTALVAKALGSDPTDTNSFAANLGNAAYTSMVSTFNFFKNGVSVLQQPSVLSSITTQYAQTEWEQQQDQTTPGLSAALDFRSRGSTITSVDAILGDANFRAVVTGALGIPPQIAFQPLEAQEKAIATRVDLSKFKDPKFIEQMAQQYLIMNNLNNTSSNNSTTSLFA
jgi:hypothetical protein